MGMSYRPYERRSLENLISALGSGLAPDVGYSILSDIQSSAQDRFNFQREKLMQRRALRQQVMPQMADYIAQTAASGLPASVAQTDFRRTKWLR